MERKFKIIIIAIIVVMIGIQIYIGKREQTKDIEQSQCNLGITPWFSSETIGKINKAECGFVFDLPNIQKGKKGHCVMHYNSANIDLYKDCNMIKLDKKFTWLLVYPKNDFGPQGPKDSCLLKFKSFKKHQIMIELKFLNDKAAPSQAFKISNI